MKIIFALALLWQVGDRPRECPFGTIASGGSCLTNRDDTRDYYPMRGGSCPWGTTRSGDFCVSGPRR